MGRKGKVDTRRKPILQLDENKKPGAKTNKKNSRKGENTPKQKYQPLYVDGGAGEVFDPQEQEKVATEIENFLKEIVAASKQEKENLGGQSVTDEFTHPETMDTTVSSPHSSAIEVPVDTTAISFWQTVVDPKTNRSYYWNPATNEVSWTLPPNSVISNEQPAPALTGTGEAAAAPVGGSLQDYYAFYSQQIYGVDAVGQVQNAVQEEPKDKTVQMAVANANHTANTNVEAPIGTANGTIPAASDSPVASSEGFIGPVAANKHKGTLPNQDSPTVRGEKRLAEELTSPSSTVADSKKAKFLQEKGSTGGKQKQTGLSPAMSSANEQMLRFQVSTMADEFMRKLQYLHIGDEGLSALQVMKIQVETRLEDWKDGGLSSKHLLAKLKEANKLVAEYEVSAAPAGWKCVWDSASCRYFYQNISSGESSWEYPTHSPVSPAHSELSEQPLEQADAGSRGAAETMTVQMDASVNEETVQVLEASNATPAILTTAPLSAQEPQTSLDQSPMETIHPPPPPSTVPPPPPSSSGQQTEAVKATKAVTHSAGEKTLEEVRQKLQKPPRSGSLYDPEDLAPYEELERPRVQLQASSGMEFISEFPPKKLGAVSAMVPDERATKKRDDLLPVSTKASEDVIGWNVPKAVPTQQEPETAAFGQDLEPMLLLRDSDIEVAQEQVADSVPRKAPELVGNEYGAVTSELPGTAAEFTTHQGSTYSDSQQQWNQGGGDVPQEVVVEDETIYGMEEGNMGGDVEDMLQPSDELGYAGSVEVETDEVCIATAPLEQQEITEGYGPQVGGPVSELQQTVPSVEPEAASVDTNAAAGKSLEESELLLRERLLRRVMQHHQPVVPEATNHVESGSSEVAVTEYDDDMGSKAPDVAESVELTEYGPDACLLQSGEETKFSDHSQVGLQLEVSTTPVLKEPQQHTTAGREKKDESMRADIEEEGEIVSTPEKRQRPETPPKTSTGKVTKRDVEKEDSKSKSSKRTKKHHSRSRSKSKERHTSRRSRKRSDASDSGDDYSRRSSKRGRRRHDDRSDSEDYHHSRRSRRHSDSDEERSSSRKERRHSRSASRDSRDSRDKSQKRKKKDKKEKKKRRSHHSGSKERSGDDAEKRKNSTPQNIIVGKVGSLGSIRQLGQEKKAQATTPQPEQTQSTYQSQQASLQQPGPGAAYYPQTSYMYGSYQYPQYGDQTWQSQQSWDQQQQGWQGATSSATTATSTTSVTGEQAWSATTSTAPSQHGWEQPQQQAEELKEQPEKAPAVAPAPGDGGDEWQWSEKQPQKGEQELQPSLSPESQTKGTREEVKPTEHGSVMPPPEVQVEAVQVSHPKSEIPVDAEIAECDMDIEQMSSDAFSSEKTSGATAALECEKELPPGAETPPATERDRTPPPPPVQEEPPAIQQPPVQTVATAFGAETTTSHQPVQEQPTTEKPALHVQPSSTDGSGATQSIEMNGPQTSGEQGPQTPSKEDTKQDRSTPGTPTTSEAPAPPTSGAANTPQVYNYGNYTGQASTPTTYDYSAYSQAGYDYSQAYSAYVQAAAASMAYASYSQYYANPYAAAFAGFGSPYAAYYQYANAGAFQSPNQQAAAAAAQAQQTESGKKGSAKKEDTKLMDKWNTLQTQYGKPA